MKSVYGDEKYRGYFEGWYLKQQNRADTVALIPAFHVDAKGKASASLQVITGTRAYKIDFRRQSFYANRKTFLVYLDKCVFSDRGCNLDVRAGSCVLQGVLRFGRFIHPAYDIMGPFRFVPFMECRHSVFSFHHRVDGELTINGRKFLFENGSGYMEGDRGRSFPKRYLWTQCSWGESNSIMLSIAEIPYAGLGFTGCIGFIFLDGKEYRIATYCGAKLLYISDDAILLKQKTLTLKIKLLRGRSQYLCAPQSGSMIRTIHESASCSVKYTCSIGKKILLDFISEQASFEGSF